MAFQPTSDANPTEAAPTMRLRSFLRAGSWPIDHTVLGKFSVAVLLLICAGRVISQFDAGGSSIALTHDTVNRK